MGLFGFGRKKAEEKAPECCCSSNAAEAATSGCCCDSNGAQDCACCGNVTGIKVLGASCKACHTQYENVKSAVRAMGLSVEVEYITDMEQVMAYGAMSMPAIVVNEQLMSMGKVLKPAEVEQLLRKPGC